VSWMRPPASGSVSSICLATSYLALRNAGSVYLRNSPAAPGSSEYASGSSRGLGGTGRVQHRLELGQVIRRGHLAGGAVGVFGVFALVAWLGFDQRHDLADQVTQQRCFGCGEPGAGAAAADRPERFHEPESTLSGWALATS